MPSVVQALGALNTLARTVIAGVFVTLIGVGGWLGYGIYSSGERALKEKDEQLVSLRSSLEESNERLADQAEILQKQQSQINRLQQINRDQAEQIQRLETAMRLLKVDHRLARITVLSQETKPDSDQLVTSLRFVEIDDVGNEIDQAKTFRINGELVYVDYWVVKFDDKYVERSDLDRATSICLFRRLFGEFQNPSDGFQLDNVGARPKAYAGGQHMSDFERRIWNDFWEFANNTQRASEMGIRAAHGEAVSTKLRPGKSYRIQLRASDGLSIVAEEDGFCP